MQYFQRLRDMREDKDKSQKEIADFLNTTRQQYARWESGDYQCPIEIYKELARFYNVSLDYLAGLTDKPKKLYWGVATSQQYFEGWQHSQGGVIMGMLERIVRECTPSEKGRHRIKSGVAGHSSEEIQNWKLNIFSPNPKGRKAPQGMW